MRETYSCDGCCYREWHNGDHSKCNFLIKNECLVYELAKASIIKGELS